MPQKCWARADAIMACESGLGRAAARAGRRLRNYRFIFNPGLIKRYSSLISASGCSPPEPFRCSDTLCVRSCVKTPSRLFTGAARVRLVCVIKSYVLVCLKLEARRPINHFRMSKRLIFFSFLNSAAASFIHASTSVNLSSTLIGDSTKEEGKNNNQREASLRSTCRILTAARVSGRR